jgi:hypothetical protein
MTQQYIVGELSCLLAELQPGPDERLGGTADQLRRKVEVAPPALLPQLAREAIDLTETMCWADLEQGDMGGFCRHAKTATALRHFTASASLLP